MATKKKTPATPKTKSKMTAERRAKLAEKAKQQWADKNSKLRIARAPDKLMRRPPKNAATLIREGIAEFGASVTALCEYLGCNRRLFFDWIKRHDDIRQAYEEGRAIMEERLTSELYKQAMAGYAPAAMFLLKAKFGLRDAGPVPDK